MAMSFDEEVILVIEDDQSHFGFVKLVLGVKGFNTIHFPYLPDWEEIEAVSSCHNIVAVISDCDLPPAGHSIKSGLAEKLRGVFGEKLLIMSGDLTNGELARQKGFQFIDKGPGFKQELEAWLEGLLEQV